MNKKVKGFTLIELLAIIVILAIMAIITVSIILNVIDNSKKESIKDSAYDYKDAVNKYYIAELYNQNLKLNGDYTITDKGELSDGINTYPIQVSGTMPTGGTLSYENNVLKNGCITIDEYKTIIENGKVIIVEKGICKFGGQVITDIPGTGHTEVKAIVYLDPTNLFTECNEKLAATNVNENGSPTGIKSGCMKWYAFKDENGYYTMLLDHNTTAAVPWITQADYEQTGSQTTTPSEVGLSYASENMENGLPDGTWYSIRGTNNRGPVTLLNQLKADTSNWVVAEDLTENDSYTAEWTSYSNTYYSGNQKYTISYNGYKARLLSTEEVDWITRKGTDGVSFDTKCPMFITTRTCSAGTNEYAWVFDNLSYCIKYGCNVGYNSVGYKSDPWGYWTMSPLDGSDSFVINVNYNGGQFFDLVNDTTDNGVRPVIKVSKDRLGIN